MRSSEKNIDEKIRKFEQRMEGVGNKKSSASLSSSEAALVAIVFGAALVAVIGVVIGVAFGVIVFGAALGAALGAIVFGAALVAALYYEL